MDVDILFSRERTMVEDFRFDDATATVFDNMVSRSVPMYHEIQRMVAELAADFATSGTNLCDLGCATGTTLLHLDQATDAEVCLVGVDNAQEMLARAEEKLRAEALRHRYLLRCADLHQDDVVENASVVLMLFTLQFIRRHYRQKLVRNIVRGLEPGGCLILAEKLTLSDPELNRLYIKHYYDMKRRNGYSELEIAQKREALENVLIPYRLEENRELLLGEGFRTCEEFFRWYNFAGLVAVK